jgi:hypothetical protein
MGGDIDLRTLFQKKISFLQSVSAALGGAVSRFGQMTVEQQ